MGERPAQEAPRPRSARPANGAAMLAARQRALQRHIQRFPQARVLVVGDLILDHYVWGTVNRISPEAPVPVVHVDSESVKLGGAANGRRTLTYGVARDADIKLMNLRPDHNRITFDARLGYAVKGGARKLEDLTLPVLGHYNALNALAALAAAAEAGISDELIRSAFASFSGVKRRFSRAGDWQGVAIYDDYAHHPVEIAAVLRAARMAGKGRILAVVQPHRFTRLQSLFNEFSACLDDADIVVVTPVYSAGEAPIPGIDRDELASGLRRHGHPHVLTVDDEEGLAETIASVAKDGDLVVGLGAGTITDWINALPKRLAAQGARRERSARAKL